MRILTLDFEIILDFRKAVKVLQNSDMPFIQLPLMLSSYITISCTTIKTGKLTLVHYYRLNCRPYLDIYILFYSSPTSDPRSNPGSHIASTCHVSLIPKM